MRRRGAPGTGRLARLVYAYTALCVVGAVAVFLAVATWHFSLGPPRPLADLAHDPQLRPQPGPNVGRPPPPPTVSPPPDLLVIVGCVLLVLVATASYFFARRITLPLRNLEEAALSFGDGNHLARVGNQQDDEIGAASRAFDEMAARTSALIESQKELIANVSHEFRTPLSRMRVALDLAAERGQAEPALIDGLNLDVSELQSLVGDVLETLRVTMAGTLDGLQVIDLTALLTGVVSSFREQYEGRGIELEACEPVCCRAEPELLRRALANLVDNALKYSSGAVTISVRNSVDWVQVEVIDHGVGISPEDLEKVFVPFFRVERSRHRATGGVGLGLNLVKRIVEAHGGRVSLESEPNRGTTARVELPAL